MYTELKIQKIIDTIARLEDRITERFPNSGIGQVCKHLHLNALNTQTRITELAKPNPWIRAGVIIAIVLFIALLTYTISIAQWEYRKPNLIEMLQITEALINDIVLVGAALYLHPLSKMSTTHTGISQ